MTLRAAVLRHGLLLTTIALLSHSAHAQCANSPALGTYNTCFGTNALAADNNGIYNVAFGLDALQADTTGELNTAVGAGALDTNVSGWWNTAVGSAALGSVVSGNGNTAVGHYALGTSTAGYNTAVGNQAMAYTTTGGYNVANGASALVGNTTGTWNVALGAYAQSAGTTSSFNVAVGGSTLQNLGSGNSNLALGVSAGSNYTAAESNNVLLANSGVAGESGVTRIGTNSVQTKAFVAGVYGATSASGTWVVVNSAGQLGTITSSLRFKEDVADMGSASDLLMKLRPVTFRYKPQYDNGQRLLQYGLVAEEVAAVDPGLVQFGDDGKPLTVRYHFVDAMLLGEVQKQHATLAEQAALISRQKAAIDDLTERLARLEARLAGER